MTVRMPCWVAAAPRVPCDKDADYFAPRCYIVTEALQRQNYRLRGQPSRFCKDLNACKFPEKVLGAHEDLNAAVSSCRQFLKLLSSSLGEYFGNVGESEHVQLRHRLMQKVFNWQDLVHRQPDESETVAFLELYQQQLPMLQYTLWPDRAKCPELVRSMHLAEDVLRAEYKRLCRNLRCMCTKDWYDVSRVRVRPVLSDTFLQRMLLRILPGLSVDAGRDVLDRLTSCFVPTYSFWTDVARLGTPLVEDGMLEVGACAGDAEARRGLPGFGS